MKKKEIVETSTTPVVLDDGLIKPLELVLNGLNEEKLGVVVDKLNEVIRKLNK